MVVIYPVIFTKTNDDKDTYLVEIPDINGFTEGYGLSGAVEMARDYIGGHCYALDEKDIPKASSLSNIDVMESTFADGDNSFVSIVDADLEAYKKKNLNRAIRRNVSIPAWLNSAAEEANLNVSRVLQEALISKLKL